MHWSAKLADSPAVIQTAMGNTETALQEAYEGLRLANQLCFPLYACAKEIIRQYRARLEPLGLTYTQYLTMLALWEFGSMTEGELGRKLLLDSGTLAPLLKRLQRQGYIDRIRPKENERKLYISLTAQGEQLKQEAIHIPDAMRECLPLSEEEQNQLGNLLKKAMLGMEFAK